MPLTDLTLHVSHDTSQASTRGLSHLSGSQMLYNTHCSEPQTWSPGTSAVVEHYFNQSVALGLV